MAKKDEEQGVDIHFDNGCEINVISQRLVVELDLKPLKKAALPLPGFMSGQRIYCYGAHRLRFTCEDSWGSKRECQTIFYAIDKEGPDLVLGLPGQASEKIHIDPESRTWRYGIASSALQVVRPDRFAKYAKKHTQVYALVVADALPTSKQVTIGELGAQANSMNLARGSSDLPSEFEEYSDVFSVEEAGRLPQHQGNDHAIETTDAPPHGPLYNLSNLELAELRRYIDEALKKGWIQHSTSPAGAPILFVPKKDGGLRLCVDYRGLNKVTIKNRHPLPLIGETLDRLNGAKVFTKLDLKDAYHRIRIKEGDEWKTAFRTRYGHFEYMVMPFGLTNAPATFQAYINKALAGLLDEFCVVYLDDILIFSNSKEEHQRHVREVLERLRRFRLFANPKKCQFSATEVEFLGFIVSTEGVAMDQSRVDAIRSWPKPTSYHEVQVFLGFCNFFRRFIHRYSQIAGPLTGLLKGSQKGKKSGPFEWPESAEQAFRQLRDQFLNPPLLRHFNPSNRTRIETDASDFGIAGILSQLQETGQWHPIAFWSRKLLDPERNYETHDQELLAIVMAMKQWRHYCEGSFHAIEVLTDHNNLRGFMNVKALNGRQARWAMSLSPYDFIISHRAGKTNPADAPSRRPDYKSENTAMSRLLPTLQQKLAVVGGLKSPIFEAIRKSYSETPIRKQGAFDGNANVAIHSVCAGESHSSIKRAEAQLLGSMTSAVRRTSQQVVHPSRRNPQPESSGSEGETPAQSSIGASNKKPIGEAGIQLVPRTVVRLMALQESAYGPESKSMVELIRALQEKDVFVHQRRAGETIDNRNQKAGTWEFDTQGLLRCDDRLYVPNDGSVRGELMKRHHDDPLAGHFGCDKTCDLIQRKYFWRTMPKDIKEYIDSCDICQRTKVKRHRPYGEMQALPVPTAPWKQLSFDFITDLPPSKRRGSVYNAILVVVDRYTKMTRYIPCRKTINAVELADLFWEEIVLRYGAPEGVVSDRGSLFTSSFWSELCFYSQIKRRLSTAFHPQTDGQTERQNQTLEHYLRTFCNEKQNNWASLLAMAEYVYHNAKHSTTGVSPFMLMYGYNPEIHVRLEDEKHEEEVPAAKEKIEAISKLRKELEQRWQRAIDSQVKAYNKKHKPISFNVGDLVMLSTKNLKQKRPNKKLSHKAIGPFRIKDVVGSQAYRLILPTPYRIHPVFHVQLLEPYHRRKDDDSIPEFAPPELIDDEEEWEVEIALDKRKRKGVVSYLVHWKGWPDEYDQWVPEQDMENAPKVREAFDKKSSKRRKR